mmetsp:Transcript_21156/g.68204  ORF Transcript_21156/g.68204 Transcript_21156/m.68204 type:complete len:302 (-) Transcript_21156:177-1082(-)
MHDCADCGGIAHASPARCVYPPPLSLVPPLPRSLSRASAPTRPLHQSARLSAQPAAGMNLSLLLLLALLLALLLVRLRSGRSGGSHRVSRLGIPLCRLRLRLLSCRRSRQLRSRHHRLHLLLSLLLRSRRRCPGRLGLCLLLGLPRRSRRRCPSRLCFRLRLGLRLRLCRLSCLRRPASRLGLHRSQARSRLLGLHGRRPCRLSRGRRSRRLGLLLRLARRRGNRSLTRRLLSLLLRPLLRSPCRLLDLLLGGGRRPRRLDGRGIFCRRRLRGRRAVGGRQLHRNVAIGRLLAVDVRDVFR